MILLSGEEAPDCAACVRRHGLCGHHARRIAALVQPYWYRLVGTHYRDAERDRQQAMSPDARRVYNRKRVRAARRAQMEAARLRDLASLTTRAA